MVPEVERCFLGSLAYIVSIVGNEHSDIDGLRDQSRSPATITRRVRMSRSPNHFLSSPSSLDRDMVQAHARPLKLAQGAALYRADDIISSIYFPHTGIISMIVREASGHT